MKFQKRWSFLLFLLVIFMASQVWGETRVAVVDFRNNAEGVTDSVRFAITEMLITELAQTPGVSVMERSRLEAIAQEQRLSASGLVESSTAVQVGRLAGVQLIVTGAITEFANSKSGGVIPLPIKGFGGIAVGESKAFVTLDVRTIDAETGRVIRTFRQQGEADRELGGLVTSYGGFGKYENGGILASAARDCVLKVTGEIRKDLQMMGVGSAYHLVEARGKDSIIIDAGVMNANVAKHGFFAVRGEGNPIVGINGEILGVEKYTYALLRCCDPKAQYSICSLVKGKLSNIQRGDLVEPYYGNVGNEKISSRVLGEIGSSPQGGSGVVPAPLPSSPEVLKPQTPSVPVQTPAPMQSSVTAQPQAPPLAPLPARGGVANTSESLEIVDLYPIDTGIKNQIKIAHKGGYYNYSKKRYSKAYKTFVQAHEFYAGNYLDAYWAARAAHKKGSKKKMKEWLDKALSINPNYEPARAYKEKYGK